MGASFTPFYVKNDILLLFLFTRHVFRIIFREGGKDFNLFKLKKNISMLNNSKLIIMYVDCFRGNT